MVNGMETAHLPRPAPNHYPYDLFSLRKFSQSETFLSVFYVAEHLHRRIRRNGVLKISGYNFFNPANGKIRRFASNSYGLKDKDFFHCRPANCFS